MSDIASVHDKLFRSIMNDKDAAVAYFQSYLPLEIAGRLDFESLTQLSDVYVSGDLKKFMSDIVFSCKLKDSESEVRVSLLIEHKSYADKFSPVQIGNYLFSGYLKQLQNEKSLSLIIPILLYHGQDNWEYCTLAGLFPELDPGWLKFLPDFAYIYNNLAGVSDEEIAAFQNALLKELIYLLKYAFDAELLSAHFEEVLFNPPVAASSAAMRAIYIYLKQQSKIEENKIREIMEALPQETRKKLMSIGDYIEEKVFERGMEKGIEKGIEQGIEKGRGEGISEKNHTATIRMIRKGYTDAEICDVLEVAVEYVKTIRAEVEKF